MDHGQRRASDGGKGETLLERAVRRELKRLDLTSQAGDAGRLSNGAPVMPAEPKKPLH